MRMLHTYICPHIHVFCTYTQVTLETDSGQAARADGEAFMVGLWRTGVLTVKADKDDDVEGGPSHSQHKISRQQAREALRICLSVYLFIYLFLCLSICVSIDASICLSVCLSIYPSIHQSIYLSFHLSVYLSIYIVCSLCTCVHR